MPGYSGDVNVMQRWNFRTDSFDVVSDMTRLAETLEIYGGFSKKEIENEIAEKVRILNWMTKNDIIDVDNAGFVVANYYKSKDKVIDVVDNDVKYSRDIFK